MSVVIELLAEFFLHFVAYGVGRVFVMIFMPWYRIEPVSRHDRAEVNRWKWRGFSYLDGGKRVMRFETAQFIGIVIVVGLIAMGYSLSR